MYPLRRVGPKGTGPNGGNNFERITWDEAISEIGTRWREIIATYGAQAIMPQELSRQHGPRAGHQLGRSILQPPRLDGEREDLLHLGLVDGVAADARADRRRRSRELRPLQVHRHLGVQYDLDQPASLAVRAGSAEARRQGGRRRCFRLAHRESRPTGTSALSPAPTARSLSASSTPWLSRASSIRTTSTSTRTAGRSSKARAAEFPLDYVEEVTGVKAADVAKFAREFATSQPSAIRIGVAIERSAGGAQAARAVYAIPAVAGSWRHVGGGMLQLPLWDFPVDWVKAARPDWIKPGTRVVNNLRLGQALNGEMKLDPPIKSLFVFCTNPVSQSPETNKIVEGLKREDLFTVVAEHFITDTAKYRRHHPAVRHGGRSRGHDVVLGPLLLHRTMRRRSTRPANASRRATCGACSPRRWASTIRSSK